MSIEAMKRIKALLQDGDKIDSHTISAVVAECDAVILAQRPVQVPMTDEEIGYWYSRTPSNFVFSHFKAAIRSAEAHHGIKAPRSQVTPNQTAKRAPKASA